MKSVKYLQLMEVAALRPGTAVDDVVAAGDRHPADFGLLEAKEYDSGHGVGAEAPEHPRLLYGTGRELKLGWYWRYMLQFVVPAQRPPSSASQWWLMKLAMN